MSILHYLRPGTRRKLLRGEYVYWLENHPQGERLKRYVLSFPLWVQRQDFAALWRERQWRAAASGEPHEFDHIIPMNHPHVCGLSVPENLRVIPRRCNGHKGNRVCLHQASLISEDIEPHQMRLPL